VLVPTTVPAGTSIAGVTPGIPIGLQVRWDFYSTYNATDPTQNVRVPRGDLRFIEGDGRSPVVKVAFKPVSATSASTHTVTAVANVAVTSGLAPEYDSTKVIPLTLAVPAAADAAATIADVVLQTLQATADTYEVQPGQLVTLRLAGKPPADPAGVIRELQTGDLTVQVRGAIPLGPVVDALTQPLQALAAAGSSLLSAGAVAAGAPDPAPGFAAAGNEVGGLLQRALSVPVALDLTTGQTLRTLVPADGNAPQPGLDSAFSQAPTPQGSLPIGAWPMAFTVTGVSWTVVGSGTVLSVPLAPGAPVAIGALVSLPPVRTLGGVGSGTPVIMTVTPTVTVNTIYAGDVTVSLPPIPLALLPLLLPETAVVCGLPLANYTRVEPPAPANTKLVLVCQTSALAGLMPTPDAAVRIFSNAQRAIQCVVALADELVSSWRTDPVTQDLAAKFDVLNRCLAAVVRAMGMCVVDLMEASMPSFTVPLQPSPAPIYASGGNGVAGDAGLENQVRSLFSFGPDDPNSGIVFCEDDVDPGGNYLQLRGDGTTPGGWAAGLLCLNSNMNNYYNLSNTWVGTASAVPALSASQPLLGNWEAIWIRSPS
jgi:hypothetical protein